jgi:hypothetical protein
LSRQVIWEAQAIDRVMYDITPETVSVWHLGRGWAGS